MPQPPGIAKFRRIRQYSRREAGRLDEARSPLRELWELWEQLMVDDKLKQKGHAEQNLYFRKKDEELLQKLRRRVKLGDLTSALAEKLQIEDPELLNRITDLGVTLETGPALLLAPLVQVAWAEGKVTGREERAVLAIAEERGVAKGSPSHKKLEEWLATRPSDALFTAAVEAIRLGLSVCPEDERNERIKGMVALCRQVAGSSGGLARELGLTDGIQEEERAILEAIAKRLTSA
jgi:hypothetical protein